MLGANSYKLIDLITHNSTNSHLSVLILKLEARLHEEIRRMPQATGPIAALPPDGSKGEFTAGYWKHDSTHSVP